MMKPLTDLGWWFLCAFFGGIIFEKAGVSSQIEQLVEKLPYCFVKVEIELPSVTLVLEKARRRTIGF